MSAVGSAAGSATSPETNFEGYLRRLTTLVSSKFEHSLSGNLSEVDRGPLPSYKAPEGPAKEGDLSAYDLIRHHMTPPAEPVWAFRVMLISKTADCFEQSLLLAGILRTHEEFSKTYQVFLASSSSEELPHTFVITLPRDKVLRHSSIIVKSIFEGSAYGNIPGCLLIEDEHVMVADPWQNKFYSMGGVRVTHEVNPLSYQKSPVYFPDHRFVLTNLDVTWLDMQKELKAFRSREPSEKLKPFYELLSFHVSELSGGAGCGAGAPGDGSPAPASASSSLVFSVAASGSTTAEVVAQEELKQAVIRACTTYKSAVPRARVLFGFAAPVDALISALQAAREPEKIAEAINKLDLGGMHESRKNLIQPLRNYLNLNRDVYLFCDEKTQRVFNLEGTVGLALGRS